ncbi:MAG: serine/threonine protein kinase [Chloroflexi bacterium]|nr:serine/threonine protein kinase [Chloroflexota bacterium]
MLLTSGSAIGPYRLMEPAGAGGMAQVWRAYDTRLDRYVAIKFLSPQYATDPTYLERFRREARAISRLDHPNILTIHDFGEQDGWTYMVSPYLGGGTLAGRLRRGPWSIAEALHSLEPLASALDYAHAQGIVHRDVKPSNVLLTTDGRVVLSDFGIARIVEGSTMLSQAGLIVGTPMYMSPEQADGQPAGPPSDLYSLGVVAYEMLTGRPPFLGETPLALLRAHLDKPLPPARSLNPALPEAIEAALFKVMAKDPADRYASGAHFITALRAAAHSPTPASQVTTQVAPPPPLPQPAPTAPLRAAVETPPPTRGQPTVATDEPRRVTRRRALAVGMGVAAAGIGVLAFQAAGIPMIPTTSSATPTPRPPATAPAARAAPAASAKDAASPTRAPATPSPTPPAADPVKGRELQLDGYALALSPDGKTLAVGDSYGKLSLWNTADGSQLFSFPTAEPLVSRLKFSPSGDVLGIVRGSTVQLWNVAQQQQIEILELGLGVGGMAFSPDGQTVAAGRFDGVIHLLRASNLAKIGALRGHATVVSGIAFSPDGQTLASAAGDATVRLWRVSDESELHRLSGHTDQVWHVVFSPDGQTLASASRDATVRLWKAADGSAIRVLKPEQPDAGTIYGLGFSADGRTLAAASNTVGTVLWRVADGAVSGILGPETSIRAMAVSADGHTLAVSGRSVNLWRLPWRRRD